MAGGLGAAWHKSNLNEYLAQCFLSALGVSAPVIRQEDIGIDFYCALSTEADHRLTFHSAYTVQCGSKDGKQFVYGGFTKPAAGKEPRWMGSQIDWLFDQELPFFVCTVDVDLLEFRLYSTSPKWLLRHKFGRMAEIELCPDEIFNPLENSRGEHPICPKSAEHDEYSYRIPLREPIVELTTHDLRNEGTLENARAALKKAIEIEQENITYNKRLKTYFVEWPIQIVPNDAGQFLTGQLISFNETQGAHIGPQLDVMRKIATVLAINLHAQGSEQAAQQLAPVFRLFGPQTFSEQIRHLLHQCVVDAWLRK